MTYFCLINDNNVQLMIITTNKSFTSSTPVKDKQGNLLEKEEKQVEMKDYQELFNREANKLANDEGRGRSRLRRRRPSKKQDAWLK